MDAGTQKQKVISDVYVGGSQSPPPASAVFTMPHNFRQHTAVRPQQYLSEVIVSGRASPQKHYARFYRTTTPVAAVVKAAQKPSADDMIRTAHARAVQLSKAEVLRAHTRPTTTVKAAQTLPQPRPKQPPAAARTFQPPVKPKKKSRISRFKPSKRVAANMAISLAVLMSGLLGFMSYSYHKALQKVEARPAEQAVQGDSVTVADQPVADAPETVTTSQLNEKPVSGYSGGSKLAPDTPYKISIPKLKVSASIIGVGITKAGAMNVPGNIWQVGWDKTSAKPKENTGVVILNGHVHGPTQPGVFANLTKLVAGDAITVSDAGGTKYDYKVVSLQTFKAGEAEANVHQSGSATKQGLNLITCTGKIVKDHYEDRLVVYAERQ